MLRDKTVPIAGRKFNGAPALKCVHIYMLVDDVAYVQSCFSAELTGMLGSRCGATLAGHVGAVLLRQYSCLCKFGSNCLWDMKTYNP